MNNLNTTSDPVLLDLTVNYDNDISSHYFDENFKSLSGRDRSLVNERFSNVEIYQFIDYGNFEKIDLDDPENFKFTKIDLIEFLLENFDRSELNKLANDYFDKCFSKLAKCDLLLLATNEVYYGYFNQFLLDLGENKYKFEVLPIRGFCQGDYAEIIFSHKDIKDYKFKDRDQFLSDKAEYFHNLFYRSPVYCSLDIDDETIGLHEYMRDQYEYDKDEILQIAKDHIEHEHKDFILHWIDDNLPVEPDQ